MKGVRYPCPCCGYLTYPEPVDSQEMRFGICEVCFWENDNVQRDDPDYAGGANTMSLNEARASFKKYGATDPDKVAFVRPPRPEEKPN